MKDKIYIVITVVILIIGKLTYEIYNWNTPYEKIIQGPKSEIHTGIYTTNKAEFYSSLKIIGVLIAIGMIIYISEKSKNDDYDE